MPEAELHDPEPDEDEDEELGNLYVRETFVNQTKGYRFGEGEWYETFTDNPGRLFLDLQREYGRCMSKMYVGDGLQVGWVFEKRMKYEDARHNRPDDFYIREVWVEVSRTKPESETRLYNVISPWEKAKVSA